MKLKAGDILGFSSFHPLGAAITLASYGVPFWSLSHVAIVGEHDDRLMLFESTFGYAKPCLIQGKVIDGVQAHDISEVVAGYRGRVWHYPLYRHLYPHENKRMNWFLTSHLGRPYDAIGAVRSGGIGYSLIESMLRRADLSSLFCSELACAAHAQIGIFATGNVSRWNPTKFVRAERSEGILQKPWRRK